MTHASTDYSYLNTRRVAYDCGEFGTGVYVPVCPTCGRRVRADKIWEPSMTGESNATCSKCGRIKMPFEGYI